MKCDECGHEMLVAFLGQFYTEYECPACGMVTGYCGSLDDIEVQVDDTEDLLYHTENEDGTGKVSNVNDGAKFADKTGG